MVEKEIRVFVPQLQPTPSPSGSSSLQWPAYKSRLISATAVALDHFTKLVTELDGGLDAMLVRYTPGEISYLKEGTLFSGNTLCPRQNLLRATLAAPRPIAAETPLGCCTA
jgi:hypothetical protein